MNKELSNLDLIVLAGVLEDTIKTLNDSKEYDRVDVLRGVLELVEEWLAEESKKELTQLKENK